VTGNKLEDTSSTSAKGIDFYLLHRTQTSSEITS